MHIQVSITYDPDDQPAMSTTDIADIVFDALNADKNKDSCSVVVTQASSINPTSRKIPGI